MDDPQNSARRVLEHYGAGAADLAPLGSGLINLTWLVTQGGSPRRVLQRVASLFPPEINRDIDVITRRLAAAGMMAPEVLKTADGGLWVTDHGWTWRMLSWLPGNCLDSLNSAAQGHSAGRLLASFHVALADLQHEFANPRLGVHDTPRHLAALRDALKAHARHPRYAEVAPLAGDILAAADALPGLPPLPDRIVHGDPKINNMLFDPMSGVATALVDFDTVGRMPLPLELGDALRSWCNPQGEDGRRGVFSAELFSAALTGYAEVAGHWITPAEVQAIVPATETIILELAARFCADACNETYFGWDAQRFATRGEHNEVRAAGQLSLARSFVTQRDGLSAEVRSIFAAATA